MTFKVLFAAIVPPPVNPVPAITLTDVWSMCSFATKFVVESWSTCADADTKFAPNPTIAAVASVSGAMLDAESLPTHPMPVLIIHGAEDNVIPYDGSNDYNSVESTLNYWMNFNKIDSLSQSNTMISGNNIIQYFSYENGKNGVSVEHYKINQGGHEWFNLNYEGQNTSELIWNFFSKYDINGFIE